jgi:hypothetical protein
MRVRNPVTGIIPVVAETAADAREEDIPAGATAVMAECIAAA